jgi:GNAT superfamily N-acetyltransferase
MDAAETLALFDRQLRREAVMPDPAYAVERLADVTRIVGPTEAAHDNTILWSGLDTATADAAIDREVALFRALGHDFEWKLFSHDQPADLGARLVARGFMAEETETLAVRDLAEDFAAMSLPAGVALHRLRDPAGLPAIDALHRAVYPGEPAWLGAVLAEEMAAAPDRLSVYLAMVGDLCVSAGWLRFHPGSDFADLWGGATHPDWRGHGVYRALVAVRAREARERGARFLTVDASDESARILARLGFITLAATTPYLFTA